MPPHTLAQGEHIYGFEGTTAQTIFITGFVGLLVLGMLLVKINWRQLAMGGALFATALTASVSREGTTWAATWMFPVQFRRAEIHLVFGILLTLMVIASGQVRVRWMSAQGVILLLLGWYGGLMQFYHRDANEALQTLGFLFATVPCMIFAAPAMARDFEGCLRILRTIMWVFIIWTFCCSVQFVINPALLLNSAGRFWGMLANAQQAALYIAPTGVIAIWLLMTDPQRRTKVLWFTVAAISMLFLIWTASRTGALMFALGLVFVLAGHGGRAIVWLPVAAIVCAGLYVLSNALQIQTNLERLVSTEDTRKMVWETQWSLFLENPLFGVGWGETGGTESSYIGGLAGYGIGYGLLMLALVGVSVYLCAKFMLARRLLAKHERHLVDLYCAFNAMYFAGAAFEGYIPARSSTTLTMMLMFTGLGVHLNHAVEDARSGVHRPDHHEYGAEHDEHGAHAESGVEPYGA